MLKLLELKDYLTSITVDIRLDYHGLKIYTLIKLFLQNELYKYEFVMWIRIFKTDYLF